MVLKGAILKALNKLRDAAPKLNYKADWLAELRRTTAVFVNVRGVANDTPDAIQLLHQVTVAAQFQAGRQQFLDGVQA